MHVDASFGGIYPRSESLVQTTRRLPPDLSKRYREEKERIITFQEKVGVSHVVDPLSDWNDIFRPFTEELGGLTKGALARYYENNTFYRQPVVISKITGKGNIALRHLDADLLSRHANKKVTLPDPFTFADCCEDRFYGKKEDLMFDLAEALAQEARTLHSSGFSILQLNGPSIARVREHALLKRIGEATEIISRAFSSNTFLHLFFDDVSPIIRDLLDFKVDGIGIDFTMTKLTSLKDSGFDKILAAGLVDARSTYLEASKQIASKGRLAMELLEPKGLHLIPNADLEFLPQEFANQKIRRLVKAARMIEGEEHG